MDEQWLNDQLEPIYKSFVLIQYVAWRTCQWTIETGGKRGSVKFVLTTPYDDYDDDARNAKLAKI